jgi:acyl-CoA thioester hydrolase
MPAIETLKTIVNTWECDENDHMNVQFYWSKFADADAHFLFLAGLDPALLGPRRVRHVRYHAEMRAGTPVTCTSSLCADGPHPVSVVHEMREGGSGRLMATALDGYATAPAIATHLLRQASKVRAPMPPEAAPRSFAAPPAALGTPLKRLETLGATVTYRGRVMPADCQANGFLDDRGYVARFTDAGPHAWAEAGLHHDFLAENTLGRVAVEMKLTVGQELTAGTLIHVLTAFTAVGRSTFSMRHHIVDTRADRIAAIGELTVLIMDLKARRSVPLPVSARERLSERVILES